MQQKIIQIGNSSGVLISKTILEELGLKNGMKIVVESDQEEQQVIISKNGVKKAIHVVSPRFFQIVEKVNKQYRSALQELATK